MSASEHSAALATSSKDSPSAVSFSEPQPQSATPAPCQLLDLPSEIRQHIYEHHFTSAVVTFELHPQATDIFHKQHPFWIHTTPQVYLLQTCKQVWREASHLLYEYQHVQLVEADGLTQASNYMTRARRRHIRSLSGVSSNNRYGYQHLLQTFPNLEAINFRLMRNYMATGPGTKITNCSFEDVANAAQRDQYVWNEEYGKKFKSFTVDMYLSVDTVVDTRTFEEMGKDWKIPDGEHTLYGGRSFVSMRFYVPIHLDFISRKVTIYWNREQVLWYSDMKDLDPYTPGPAPSALAEAEHKRYQEDVKPLLKRYSKFLDYTGAEARHIKPARKKGKRLQQNKTD